MSLQAVSTEHTKAKRCEFIENVTFELGLQVSKILAGTTLTLKTSASLLFTLQIYNL